MTILISHPTLRKVLEGIAMIIALVGSFYLGYNIGQVEVSENKTANEAEKQATTEIPKDYQYILVDGVPAQMQ